MPSYTAPKRRQPPRVLLLLVGVFVVVAVVVVATHKSPTTPAATPHVTDSKTTTTTGGGKTTTTAARRATSPAAGAKSPVAGGKTTTTTALGPRPHVLFDIQGYGDDTIGRFLIGTGETPWDVNWSYDCSKLSKKGAFNYTIVFLQGDRADTSDLGPRQTGVRGSGAERYQDAGTFGMTVATQCSWTVEISDSNP
jgi:hypothetical protein